MLVHNEEHGLEYSMAKHPLVRVESIGSLNSFVRYSLHTRQS
jgi:hypothetical protein